MKKILTLFLLFISTMSGLFTLSSCKQNLKLTENNEKIEEIITNDYIQFYWPNLPIGKTGYMYIEYFLGIYDDLYVASFYDSNWKPYKPHIDTIDGFTFEYPVSGIRTVVWKNHKFFELTDAYAKGILTLEQIEKIHEQYLRYEWPKDIQTIIKEDYIKFFLAEYANAKPEEVYFDYRLGSYDSMYAGIMRSKYKDYKDYTKDYSENSKYDEEAIGKFLFTYPSENRILVWKEHRFYLLKDAYEQGLINDKQLDSIHKEFNKTVWRYSKY